ncbi:hypothetical protein LPJ73_005017 [Coemansia sp. RSA 2703]|nr:hypothetical protein LPJ73_005035 [Coemansia sp. RSA 2703]KAJ1844910.1 hypothetical protein LPJ73_005017 [Coemansia sp. RSA 2703]KAJ2378762.1 hypothetical protein IW150_000601 [Coemansia sp. RSA 2607]
MLKNLVLLLAFLAVANAVTLRKWIASHEKTCFYTQVTAPGQKVSFYFAVHQGGNFDIDFEVEGPNNRQLFKGEAERQGDYVFTANQLGEYAFCFKNGLASFADKQVEFDISVENEVRPEDIAKRSKRDEAMNSVVTIASDLSQITKFMKYFRTRENRNFATVSSTESRVWWFSAMQSLSVVLVAVIQVYAIRALFTAKRSRL